MNTLIYKKKKKKTRNFQIHGFDNTAIQFTGFSMQNLVNHVNIFQRKIITNEKRKRN